MSGRPGEESRTSDQTASLGRCQWPLFGLVTWKAIIEAGPRLRLPHDDARPRSLHVHVHPRPPRSPAWKSSQVAAAKARRLVRRSLASHWRPAVCVGGCGVGPGGPRGVEHGDKPANAVPARCPNMTH